MEEVRAIVAEHFGNSRVELVRLVNAAARHAESLSNFDKIRIHQIHRRIAALIEQLLILRTMPRNSLSKQDDLDRHIPLRAQAQFLDGHLETAVSNEHDDFFVRATNFCSKGRGQSITHRTRTARRYPLVGVFLNS